MEQVHFSHTFSNLTLKTTLQKRQGQVLAQPVEKIK